MHDITLLQLFNDDIGISQQLLQLIKDEFQALGERNLPQLEQIIDSKMPLLSLLEQHGKERSDLLQSLQLYFMQSTLRTRIHQTQIICNFHDIYS